jgi:hypothetical protein
LDDLGVDVDNIKADHKGVRWEVVNWIHLAKRRGLVRVLVNTVIKLLVPSLSSTGKRLLALQAIICSIVF